MHIIIVDATGGVRWWSKEAERVARGMVDCCVDQFFAEPDRASAMEAIQRTIEGEVVTFTADSEFTREPWNCTAWPFESGALLCAVETVR